MDHFDKDYKEDLLFNNKFCRKLFQEQKHDAGASQGQGKQRPFRECLQKQGTEMELKE
jgi:hypothetical protein